MPLYGYKCSTCDHEFDLKLIIDERDNPCEQGCPKCDAKTVTRPVVSPRIAYSHPGSMKTTDSFNSRLKEIKDKVPERFKSNLNDNIR